MPRIKATILRNAAGYPSSIFIDGRKIRVDIETNEDGFVDEVTFKGSKIPSAQEIIKFLYEQNRIGMSLLNPAPVEVSATLKETRGIIKNPIFDDDFLGWIHGNEGIEIEEQDYGIKVVKITTGTSGWMYQNFPIALGVDWFTELYFYMQSLTTGLNVLRIIYRYTDGTTSTEYFQVATQLWEKKTCSPTAGKHIDRMLVDGAGVTTSGVIRRLYNFVMVF